jgi:hypothetical protein
MRILHFCVVALLFAAAAYVYEIKFEATLRAERVAKMRIDIQHERDLIASLRAEWAALDNPARIQNLARRHLRLQPADVSQFDSFDQLPDRPKPGLNMRDADAGTIADIITTGSGPSRDPSREPSREPSRDPSRAGAR